MINTVKYLYSLCLMSLVWWCDMSLTAITGQVCVVYFQYSKVPLWVQLHISLSTQAPNLEYVSFSINQLPSPKFGVKALRLVSHNAYIYYLRWCWTTSFKMKMLTYNSGLKVKQIIMGSRDSFFDKSHPMVIDLLMNRCSKTSLSQPP